MQYIKKETFSFYLLFICPSYSLSGNIKTSFMSLFPCSRNEALEEISTTDLKYLMLPALLGALTMKQVNTSKRLEHVQSARVYFMDFLQRCKQYEVCSFQLPKASESTADTPTEEQTNHAPMPMSQPDLITMATQRQAKIERWVGLLCIIDAIVICIVQVPVKSFY